MPIITLPTVMHTGTHLMWILTKYMPKWMVCAGHRDTYYCQWGHIGNVGTEELLEDADLIITSIRHPRRVAESFKRRGKDHEWFVLQYTSLMEDYHPRIDQYVAVDHPVRDLHVQKVNALTGYNVHMGWEVNKKSGSRKGTHDISVEDCPEVPQEFIDFYNEVAR